MKKIKIAAISMASALILPVHAAELIYEGFDYALGNGVTMDGVTTDATGIGGTWELGTSGTGGSTTITYATTGLTFGGNFKPTTGGAILMNVSGPTANRSVQMGASLTTGVVTGTIYTSYLFNTSSSGTPGGATIQNRLNNAQTTSSNAHFVTLADGTNQGSDPTGLWANGLSYSGSGTTAAANTLTINTTYLAISKFTNVGSVGLTGAAEMWVLTEAGYNDWLVLGGGLETNLTTYAVSGSHLTTSTTTTAANSLFDNSQYFSLAASGNTGAMTSTVDELRWGSDLGDVVNVVAVPEPATYGVAMGVGALFLIMARRRKAGRS